jgi:hypothetical protein
MLLVISPGLLEEVPAWQLVQFAPSAGEPVWPGGVDEVMLKAGEEYSAMQIAAAENKMNAPEVLRSMLMSVYLGYC